VAGLGSVAIGVAARQRNRDGSGANSRRRALVQIAGAVRASLAAAPFLALTRTSSQLRISRPVAYDVAGPLGDVSDMQKDVAGTTPAGFVSAILQKVMPSIYAATAPILREER
jgi:hypothetical protein